MSPPFVARRLDPDARYGLRVTLFAVAFLLVAIPFGWLLNQVETDGSLVDLDTSGAASLHDWVHRTRFAVGCAQDGDVPRRPAVAVVPRHRGDAGAPPCPALAPGDLPRRHDRPGGHPRHHREGRGEPSAALGPRPDHQRPREELPVGPRHVVHRRLRRPPPGVPADGAPSLAPDGHRRPPSCWWRSIGFSRLALGVHFLSDVVGGYVLGLAWLAVSTAAFSIWRVERGKPPVEASRGPRTGGRRRPALPATAGNFPNS